jgi:Tat protein secretion system quality control protein TatD with DNase activity
MYLLTAENVETILKDCMYKEGEITIDIHKDMIKVDGIMFSFGFHPSRVEQHKEEIFDMLKQLPKTFMETSGGGHSFLNACMDKDNNQWGEHDSIDKLICLGLAIKKIKFCLPRDIWPSLPGGMPYFVVLDKE